MKVWRTDLAKTCHNQGIGLLPWSTLAGGCGRICVVKCEGSEKDSVKDLAETCHNLGIGLPP